jgi:hypothetical protein
MMKTVDKINKNLVIVNKAKVEEIAQVRASEERFIEKNLKVCKKVADAMKKADKAYVKAMKKYNNDASVENAYHAEEAKKELLACVNTYNAITKNINDSMVAIQATYASHNKAEGVVDPAKAAKNAPAFNAYNAKIERAIDKISTSLAGYPHI